MDRPSLWIVIAQLKGFFESRRQVLQRKLSIKMEDRGGLAFSFDDPAGLIEASAEMPTSSSEKFS